MIVKIVAQTDYDQVTFDICDIPEEDFKILKETHKELERLEASTDDGSKLDSLSEVRIKFFEAIVEQYGIKYEVMRYEW